MFEQAFAVETAQFAGPDDAASGLLERLERSKSFGELFVRRRHLRYSYLCKPFASDANKRIMPYIYKHIMSFRYKLFMAGTSTGSAPELLALEQGASDGISGD